VSDARTTALDHVDEEDLRLEIASRVKWRAEGKCDYCHAKRGSIPVCAFPVRHAVIKGRQAYYFGCWGNAGHYLFDPDRRSTRYTDKMVPWEQIDSVLCYGHRGPYQNGPQVQGLALLHHRDGWTALSFWDRTVDKRGGSNSNFFVEGTLSFDEIVLVAKERFPSIWERFTFKVELFEETK
jgi:hypothetical protein